MKKCIILANGSAPGISVFNYLKKVGYTTLICADGGANTAYKLSLHPEIIIGDFDSINEKSLKYFSEKSIIVRINRQNDTDVEKCLKYAIKKNFLEAILLGATGDRLDHSFCNLGIVIKYFNQITIKVLHHNSFLIPYSGAVQIKTIPKEIISIYGLDDKTLIKSYGLKYSINNLLPFGKKESTSNIAIGSNIKLNIKGGVAFVIRNFNLMKKNGLI